MTDKPSKVDATVLHLDLVRDLSRVMSDFTAAHPEISALEIIAAAGSMIGACISSCPDEEIQRLAQQSAILSMEQAVKDFSEQRRRQREMN